MNEFTERQARAWPEAVAEAQKYVGDYISEGLYDWTIKWDDEVRPGRGHSVSALWCDGEHFVQIMMDVYGYPRVSVAEVEWLHNSADEECDCEPCRKDAEDD